MPAESGSSAIEAGATRRVFFALWPSTAVAASLASVAADCAGQFGGRATRQETIHLTLAFLGNVAEQRLPELCRAASGVSGQSFQLQLDSLAYWPHKRLAWAGCSQRVPALDELVLALRQALVVDGFAFDASHPDFVPHVTLLRRMPADAVPVLPDLPVIDWQCEHFVLAASQATEAGASYRILAEFPLSSQSAKSWEA